ASRRSPWPGGPTLPREYWRTHDLFVALATAAAVTTRLRVAAGICLLVERDPIITAKEVASLDVLSNGRVVFGIGGGWNAEEMARRGPVCGSGGGGGGGGGGGKKKMGGGGGPWWGGVLVTLAPLGRGRRRGKRPPPPILLGGHGRRALERVVDYCDGWLPIGV